MSSHHAYQMYAHITWHTWKRIGCVDMAAAQDVRNAVASASRATGVRVLRGAVLADHVHLVVSFRPDARLSDFVRLAKSVAATRANRRTTGAVRWARGYFVATIHRRDLTPVIHYVARQFERHPDRIPRERLRAQLTPGASPGIQGPGMWRGTTGPTDPGREPGDSRPGIVEGDHWPKLTPGASPGLMIVGPLPAPGPLG